MATVVYQIRKVHVFARAARRQLQHQHEHEHEHEHAAEEGAIQRKEQADARSGLVLANAVTASGSGISAEAIHSGRACNERGDGSVCRRGGRDLRGDPSCDCDELYS